MGLGVIRVHFVVRKEGMGEARLWVVGDGSGEYIMASRCFMP